MFGPSHGGHGRRPGPRANAEVQLLGHHRQGRAHLRVPAAARLPAQPCRLRLLPGHDQLVSRPRRASAGARGEGKGHPSAAAGRAGRTLRGSPFSGRGGRVGEPPGHGRNLGAE